MHYEIECEPDKPVNDQLSKGRSEEIVGEDDKCNCWHGVRNPSREVKHGDEKLAEEITDSRYEEGNPNERKRDLPLQDYHRGRYNRGGH